MYANKQRQIVKNALNQLKPNGVFYYITCSVFKSENEDNVAYFEKEFGLTLVTQQAYYNTAHASDYLFMAQFVKN
jgi:16S rRNA (cytosine967-C5)-methyltransferase